ncbi:ribosome maturation factor RimM [Kordiimonas sediminis]|uniref:Ribosome maturation factor RimM n=1 Tax=Kordiimonas sediminis TaxID=1735581 RepID=A0A919ARG1_9PROT|nr:ribosome maturation factor RimM [Kordiimonas sediminis]
MGAFGAAHGVRGDVRLKSYTDTPADIFSYKDVRLGAGGKEISLQKVRTGKDGFVVRVSGISSREDAEAVKGKQLYIAREALGDSLDEDEYFLADLIGLEVRSEKGEKIGLVRAFENFGAEDLLEVLFDEPVKGIGRYGYFPFRKALVPDVKIAEGYVSVALEMWLESQIAGEPETSEDKG